MPPLPWQRTFLQVSAFLSSVWKMVWQRISHQHQRDSHYKMVFRPSPVVVRFHTHPQVNKEATLAVVGYILVSLSASIVQMYLHRSHTTHHLLKKQPANLAAEPQGTIFLKIKQSLKSYINTLRTSRSLVGQLMQCACQFLHRHYRPT